MIYYFFYDVKIIVLFIVMLLHYYFDIVIILTLLIWYYYLFWHCWFDIIIYFGIADLILLFILTLLIWYYHFGITNLILSFWYYYFDCKTLITLFIEPLFFVIKSLWVSLFIPKGWIHFVHSTQVEFRDKSLHFSPPTPTHF